MKVNVERSGMFVKIVVICDCGKMLVIPITLPPPEIRELYEVEEIIKGRLDDKNENNELQNRGGQVQTD